MATTQPKDLQDLQDDIQVLVENDNETPDNEDDEWIVRRRLANMSIVKYETQDVLWGELWSTYTHASPVVANTTSYVLSTLADRRAWGSWLRLTINGSTQFIRIVKPQTFNRMGREGKVAYFTGNNRDGWTLKLGWTPATGDGTVGATLEFDYYRFATKLEEVSDVSEISEPGYIIYDVSAAKSLMESRNNQFSIYSTEAQRIMDSARVMNELEADGSAGTVDDLDADDSGGVIGE